MSGYLPSILKSLIVLLGVSALLVVSWCCSLTPQRDADLPYRSGTIVHHEGGGFRKGKLVEPTEIEGMLCERWVHRWQSGALRGCQLARDEVIGEWTLGTGTFLWFDEQGRLESAWLARDAELGGVPCNGGGKIGTGFHPDGSLASVFLSRDTVIDGVPCEASLFSPVTFHPNGRLASARLSAAIQVGGTSLRKGDDIQLDPEGRLVGR